MQKVRARDVFSEYYLEELSLSSEDMIEFDGRKGLLPNGVQFIATEGLPAFEGEEGFEEDWGRE